MSSTKLHLFIGWFRKKVTSSIKYSGVMINAGAINIDSFILLFMEFTHLNGQKLPFFIAVVLS